MEELSWTWVVLCVCPSRLWVTIVFSTWGWFVGRMSRGLIQELWKREQVFLIGAPRKPPFSIHTLTHRSAAHFHKQANASPNKGKFWQRKSGADLALCSGNIWRGVFTSYPRALCPQSVFHKTYSINHHLLNNISGFSSTAIRASKAT